MASGFGPSTGPGGSGGMTASSMIEVCSLASGVIAGNRTGSGLPLGRIRSWRDRALDFEPVAAVRLPEFAGEHRPEHSSRMR